MYVRVHTLILSLYFYFLQHPHQPHYLTVCSVCCVLRLFSLVYFAFFFFSFFSPQFCNCNFLCFLSLYLSPFFLSLSSFIDFHAQHSSHYQLVDLVFFLDHPIVLLILHDQYNTIDHQLSHPFPNWVVRVLTHHPLNFPLIFF